VIECYPAENLLKTIDQALDDNDQWLSPEYEALFD
jgi:hypothetical protein